MISWRFLFSNSSALSVFNSVFKTVLCKPFDASLRWNNGRRLIWLSFFFIKLALYACLHSYRLHPPSHLVLFVCGLGDSSFVCKVESVVWTCHTRVSSVPCVTFSCILPRTHHPKQPLCTKVFSSCNAPVLVWPRSFESCTIHPYSAALSWFKVHTVRCQFWSRWSSCLLYLLYTLYRGSFQYTYLPNSIIDVLAQHYHIGCFMSRLSRSIVTRMYLLYPSLFVCFSRPVVWDIIRVCSTSIRSFFSSGFCVCLTLCFPAIGLV